MSYKTITAGELTDEHIGKRVSFVYSDGWDEWPTSGRLIAFKSLDYLIYLETCDERFPPCEVCDDKDDSAFGDHGSAGLLPVDPVHVYFQ
jgi:hypothetical protein